MSKHRENWLNYCLFYKICSFVMYFNFVDSKQTEVPFKTVLVNFTENSSYILIIITEHTWQLDLEKFPVTNDL